METKKDMTHGIRETIERGMCVGCGACAVATGGAVKLTLSRHRLYQADLGDVSREQEAVASRVCPFSNDAADENQLGAPNLPAGALHDHRAGSYSSVMAGRVANDDYLIGSSSGGLTSWVLVELLRRGDVDAVVHVGRREGDEHFGYQISDDIQSLRDDRKSQYYATTMREVLEEVRVSDRRVAVVGVPCFIKAARLLARDIPEIRDSIAFYVGLVCGHLKTQFFAEALAWQVGVTPQDLDTVDFRVKNPERESSAYDFAATTKSGQTRTRRTAALIGGSWGYGAFQPEACNFCDDVFAETADIVFGDAWLPQFKSDWRGTNVVVSRNAYLDRMLDEGRARGELILDDLDLEDAVRSQAGNFRHRRQGLAVRLADDIREGKSVPQKRVAPDFGAASSRRRRLIRQRRYMSRKSNEWFAFARDSGDLNEFIAPFKREIVRYERVNRQNIRALAGRVKAVSVRALRVVKRRVR